jgi:dihydroorotase
LKIEITGGRVIDPAQALDRVAAVYVADGVIAAVDNAPSGWRADRVIDAAQCVVAPGFVDLAARLREPGLEHKATLESELAAAAAGGVTSLACPPDTDPPLDEPGLVQMLKHRARVINQAHVYPIGALTLGLRGETLTEMSELAEAGCIAFSHADAPLPDTQMLFRAMQYAGTFGHRVWLRPQDAHLARGGVAHDGEVATRLGLPAIPVSAETIALATIFALVRETSVGVHLCRLSSASGVAMVRAAKAEGLPVTCDVAVHHLHLCDVDIGWFDPLANLMPPLRATRDRDALRAGVADGTIDAICSDHAMLKWAAEAGVPMSRAVASVTTAPASIIGLRPPTLRAGAAADCCIFEPSAAWTVQRDSLRSQGKNTPFLGIEVLGRARYTLLAGQIVHERSEATQARA